MRLIDADEFVSMNREAVHSMFNKVVDEAHPTDEQMSKSTMFLEAVESVLENLEYAPTIDAVPVVMCKNCKWYVRSMIKQDGTLDERYKPDWCDLYRRVREETYFCADGERKDDDKQ